MLLRTIAMVGLVAVLSGVLACEPCMDESGADIVDIDGFELYELHHPNTGESSKLFYDGEDTIYLVRVNAEGVPIQATLTAEALAILDGGVAQLASGAELGGFSPGCLGFVDAPVSRLSVRVSNATLQFSYPLQCSPPLLAGIDELCRDLIVALPTCSASPRFHGCRPAE